MGSDLTALLVPYRSHKTNSFSAKMGIFSRRSKSSSPPGILSKKQRGSGWSDGSSCSTGSSRMLLSSPLKSPNNSVIPLNQPEAQSPNVQIVTAFLLALKSHNFDITNAVFNKAARFCFPDADMLLSEFVDEIERLTDSFPDLAFTWGPIQQTAPNTVIVCDLSACGTHTGKPYGFGPYPAVDTTSIQHADPPIQVTFTIGSDGHIEKATAFSSSGTPGPAGFYTAIGGLIM